MCPTLQAETRPYAVRDPNVRRLLQFLGLASLLSGSLLLLIFFYYSARAAPGEPTPPLVVVVLALPLYLVGIVATLLGTGRRREPGPAQP